MISNPSPQTGTVDSVFYFIVGISTFFLILITFLMIYFLVKYNKKRHKKAVNIEGNTILEIIWTVIPTLIVLIMFYVGWKGFVFLRSVPENALTVKVTARMWSWLFEYENGIKTDSLKVPVDRPVQLLLSSQDVIHSFFIPAFRIKEDAVPGLETHMWFEANQEGSYDVLCAEYCGLQHSYMLTKVNVISGHQFENWYEEEGKKVAATSVPDSSGLVKEIWKGGEKLIQVHGCVACHSTDGSEMIGPSFKGLFGTEQVVTTAGKSRIITVDEAYLRNSILNPAMDIVDGFENLMPPQNDQFSEQELKAIIQYLKEL